MKLRMMSPDDIMTIVVSIIIFAVGVFAVYTVVGQIPTVTPAHTTSIQNATFYAVKNVSNIASQVFNVVGIVMIIGAIMIIVGVIYSYVRPR